VAIESAGVVLVSFDPRAVLGVIRLSQASYHKMVQNLLWATGDERFADLHTTSDRATYLLRVAACFFGLGGASSKSNAHEKGSA
jgi:hypothetical protein